MPETLKVRPNIRREEMAWHEPLSVGLFSEPGIYDPLRSGWSFWPTLVTGKASERSVESVMEFGGCTDPMEPTLGLQHNSWQEPQIVPKLHNLAPAASYSVES
jgi:hypothetical protein